VSINQSSQEQRAYFRYGVISPLLAEDPDKTLKRLIQEQADRTWQLPNGTVKRFGFGTIENWLYAFKRFGIDGLNSGSRRDAGSFRGIDAELADKLEDLLKKHPKLRTHAIIDYLRKMGDLPTPPPSNSTLYRFIKSHRIPQKETGPKEERRAFEAPYSGYLWQADLMYGPHLPMRLANGRVKKTQTYLIGIVDDHSRLFCHGEFYFRQDLPAWLSCLETAIRKRGIPKKLYCDNGQIFVSHRIKEIAAQLGMEVRHTKVRDAAAKGKIERLFQRCRRSFLEPLLELTPPKTLRELNDAFFEWTESEYNHATHSAFGDTPIRRFMESSSHLRVLDEDNPTLFHVRDERTVKKDGTFSLHGTRYETSSDLVGCKITVSYDLRHPQDVYVHWQNDYFGKANVLDPKANHERRRRKQSEGDDQNA
jgi:transposase InsO family protein